MITQKWSETVCKQISPLSITLNYLPFAWSWINPLWSSILATLFLVVFVWFLFKLRYRFLHRHNSPFENETESRILQQQKLISELQLHNDQLKISKENLYLSISEKDRFISILIHDLRSPLRFLYKNTAYLFRNWKRDSHAELDDLIAEINNSTKQIHFLTEEMMQWISTQDNTYKIRIEEYTLLEIINELEVLYRENIFQQGNILELDIPARMKVNTDKLLLKTILRNLIDNANKNTDDGVIRIQARQAYEKIIITVSDSGVGISPSLLQHLNHYFRTSESAPELNTQFGHEIIRDFAGLLNATVGYETHESGGLSVSLTMYH
jgi:signal transduction histidine kinase